MPRCGSRYLDRRWRSHRQRAARSAAYAGPGGALPRRCSGSRFWRPSARGRRACTHRMPVRRAAGLPMVPAISQRTTARAVRSSCSAASRVASAAATRAGADRGCRGAWSPDVGRAGSARSRCIPVRTISAKVISVRAVSAKAISASSSSRQRGPVTAGLGRATAPKFSSFSASIRQGGSAWRSLAASGRAGPPS